jgi:hypothetical protein
MYVREGHNAAINKTKASAFQGCHIFLGTTYQYGKIQQIKTQNVPNV